MRESANWKVSGSLFNLESKAGDNCHSRSHISSLWLSRHCLSPRIRHCQLSRWLEIKATTSGLSSLFWALFWGLDTRLNNKGCYTYGECMLGLEVFSCSWGTPLFLRSSPSSFEGIVLSEINETDTIRLVTLTPLRILWFNLLPTLINCNYKILVHSSASIDIYPVVCWIFILYKFILKHSGSINNYIEFLSVNYGEMIRDIDKIIRILSKEK